MADVIATLVKIGWVLFCVFNLLYLLLWMERKQSAVMQDRIGANRAEIFGLRMMGLFHPIADAIKMIVKEDFIPAAANKFVYTISPFLAVYGFILSGWASNNNFAFLGSMRAGSQMISYEITMGATVMGLVMVYQTLSLNQMVLAQGEYWFGVIPKWGVFFQPLGFLLFLTAGVAETKR